MQRVAVGCVFSSEEALNAAITRLTENGIPPGDIHVGAAHQDWAENIANAKGVVADVAPDDPFHGLAGYAGAESARRVVDRAGIISSAIGAAFGLALSFTRAGNILPVPHLLQPLANALFFFVIGLFVGSVLGASLAPQQSAHAGFRLIDAMQEGSLALIVTAAPEQAGNIASLLETAGATSITRT